MLYLRFTSLLAYCQFLSEKGVHATHFDVSDISMGVSEISYAAIATQHIRRDTFPPTSASSTDPGPDASLDCLAVFYEVIYQEIRPVDSDGNALPITKKSAANRLKKIENAIWRTFSDREKAVKGAGLDILRGILSPNPPEALIRAR